MIRIHKYQKLSGQLVHCLPDVAFRKIKLWCDLFKSKLLMPHCGVVIDDEMRLTMRTYGTAGIESQDGTSVEELSDGDTSRALRVGDVVWFGITSIRRFQNRI